MAAEEVEVNVKTKGLDETNEKLQSTSELADKTAKDFGLMDTKAGKAFSSIVSGAKKGVVAMQTLKGAIIATGIGALVVAVLALGTYFTKTERGANALKVGMAGLSAIVNKLTDVLVKVGEYIANMFSSFENFKASIKDLGKMILENLINRFKAFGVIASGIGKILKGDFKEGLKTIADGTIQVATGVTNATDKIKEFGKEVMVAVDAAMELEKRQNSLNIATREAALTNAKLAGEIFKLQEIAKDQNKTLQERITALDKQANIEKKILDDEIERARIQYEIIKAKNALSESNSEDLQKEADAAVKVQELENQKLQKYVQVNAERSGLIKQARDEELRAEEEVRKAKEEADKAELERAQAELERKRSVMAEIKAMEEENELLRIEDEDARRQAALELEKERFEEDLERRLEEEEITQEELLAIKAAYGESWNLKKAELDKDLTEKAKEAAKKQIDIDRAVAQAKADGYLSAASSVIGATKAIFGENKASAIAEAIINTYQSATGAFKALASIPIVGPALGAVAAASAVAMGLKQISVIRKTDYSGGAAAPEKFVPNQNPPGFQEGGFIGGPRHSQGGVMINAEGGEYIASQRAMASAYGPLIVAANEAANRGSAMALNEERIAQIAAATVGAIPVYVTETSISNKQREVSIRERQFVK